MPLQIEQPHERRVVALADLLLKMAAVAPRLVVGSQRAAFESPQRVLLLRLERIGDLIMTLEAIRDVRELAPGARIDLAVGSWNADLARAVPSVDGVDTLDASWLAREGEGRGVLALMRQARQWRARGYDLAINFEPDIRSNLIARAAGASRTAGWASGGGGPLLDLALDYDPAAHAAANGRRLVREVFGRSPTPSTRPLLTIPESVAAAAAALLSPAAGTPLVGIHISGGRAIKQWPPERFAAVAARLADTRGATIVATGSPGDRPLIEALQTRVAPRRVIDASTGNGLLVAAAILARLDLLITGDTGPMHLAAAVGTPVVAVFGPSDPARYGPRGSIDRVVRIDLPCSPCNRIRRPPARCVGHTPDCLAGISADDVFAAAIGALDESAARLSSAGRA